MERRRRGFTKSTSGAREEEILYHIIIYIKTVRIDEGEPRRLRLEDLLRRSGKDGS